MEKHIISRQSQVKLVQKHYLTLAWTIQSYLTDLMEEANE